VALVALVAGCRAPTNDHRRIETPDAKRQTPVTEHRARSTEHASEARFVDVTERAGIRFRHQSSRTARKYFIETMGSGCAFLDADGDGWQDLLLLNNAPLPGGRVLGRPTLALYRNEGGSRPTTDDQAPSSKLQAPSIPPTFADVTKEAGLAVEMYAMGCAIGDYDNDGRDDIYVTCVLGPSRLFRNESVRAGAPYFRDVTAPAGVANSGKWGASAAWLDYDRDGLLDLFVCNYVKYASLADDVPCYAAGGKKRVYCIPVAYEAVPCTLYRNEGGGRFRDVTVASGIGAAAGKALGVAVWDADDDGWPDLFVANDTVASFQFRNEGNSAGGGPVQFREIGTETGVAYDEEGNPHSGMGIDTADVQNDGRTWVAIANFQGQQTALYREAGPLLFEDVRRESRVGPGSSGVLGFGLLFLDYDNDGLQDLLQVNGHVQDDIQEREPDVTYRQPTRLFRNLGDGTFAETGQRLGAPFSKRIVGRGCASGDFDNDGRPDLLIACNNGPALLWHNETQGERQWLTLRLIGRQSNRNGIGARVRATAGGVTQTKRVRSGSSYLSQSDLRLHFGLGPHRAADIEVRWPSGAVDRIAAVPAGGIRTIEEGSQVARP
jgi:hypothetical protein